MFIFQPPPPTRYDLHFTIAGTPVRVHPLFWLITLLLGASGGGLISLLVWVPAVFISILVHELGHAFVFGRYGQRSQVILHAAGGLTVPEPARWGNSWSNATLGPGKEILVSLGGPCAGLLLGSLVMLGVVAAGGSIVVSSLFFVIPVPLASLPTGNEFVNLLVMDMLWVNIFWSFINLLPVYPLDGGNIARYILLKLDPLSGVRTSLWISIIVAAVIGVLGMLVLRSIYILLLFAYLAFQSYQILLSRSGRGY